jgi:AcrR family transcriptional regulator
VPSQRSALKAEVIALKRKRIVEAARSLFYERGYERTTLDDIAELLHVTKPFIYSYYKNKSELLQEVAERSIREAFEAQSRILKSKLSLMEKLLRIVEEVTQCVIRNQADTIVYMREEMNLDRQTVQRIREYRKEFDRRVARLLSAGARAGVFQPVDERVTAKCIGGMLVWCALWYRGLGVLSPVTVAHIVSQNVKKMVARDATNDGVSRRRRGSNGNRAESRR